MIQIICPEPWNGDCVNEHDTGFGDRIFHWIFHYNICTIVGNIQIIVPEKYWPELLLINLPNTITKDFSLLNKNQLFPIDFQQLTDIISNEKNNFLKDSENIYYYFNIPLKYFPKIYYLIIEKKYKTYDQILGEPISKIHLKNLLVEKFFEEEFSNCCCIHLRRGHGTFPTKKFLEELKHNLSESQIKDYWEQFHKNKIGKSEFSKKYLIHQKFLDKTATEEKYVNPYFNLNNDITPKTLLESPELFLELESSAPSNVNYQIFDWIHVWKITSDSDYFNLIDNTILIENPNQKIYISSDIPMKYYSYYYDRYPNNIMDKRYYFKKFLNFYKGKIQKEKISIEYSVSISKTFENIFDLMVGFYSKILIKSNSNWSRISMYYRKKRIAIADQRYLESSLGTWTWYDYT